MVKVLRSTDNPQFDNKNATLNTTEGDNNLIEFQAEINEARGLSIVTVYDNAKEYRLDEFASHLFNIYKYISDVPTSGVVPGSDITKWALSSMGEFLLDKNYIVVKAEELSDLKVAGALKKGRKYFIDDPDLVAERGYQITVTATAVDKIALLAVLTGLNPDYQFVGVYTGVTDYVSNLGVWKTTTGTLDYDTMVNSFVEGDTITGGVSGATAEVVSDAPGSGAVGTLTLKDIVGEFANGEDISNTLSPQATALADGIVIYTFNPVLGNVVIWGGRHYKKKNSIPSSTAPDADGTNYLLLNYSIVNGYILESNMITIDLSTPFDAIFSPQSQYDDYIISRSDSRNNIIFAPLLFQWGNDLTKGNIVHEGASLDCINTLQPVQFNELNNIAIVANMITNSIKNNLVNGRDNTTDVSDAEFNLEHIGKLFTEEIRIQPAEVVTLNSARQLFINKAGGGKGIEIISASGRLEFQVIAGVSYDTNVDIELISDTATKPLRTLSGILAVSLTSSRTFRDDAILGVADTQVEDNKDVFIFVPNGEPLNGNGILCVSATYRVMSLDC